MSVGKVAKIAERIPGRRVPSVQPICFMRNSSPRMLACFRGGKESESVLVRNLQRNGQRRSRQEYTSPPLQLYSIVDDSAARHVKLLEKYSAAREYATIQRVDREGGGVFNGGGHTLELLEEH